MNPIDYQEFNSEQEGQGWYNQSTNTGSNDSTKIEVPLGTVQSKETLSWWKGQLGCSTTLGKRIYLYYLNMFPVAPFTSRDELNQNKN